MAASEDSRPVPADVSRRDFLRRVGVTSLAATVPFQHFATAQSAAPATPSAMTNNPETMRVNLVLNGVRRTVDVEPRVVLLDLLREHLHLPGTKKGCDHGQCGACTVLVNGRRVNSCLSLAVMHEGDEITTIEGLEQDGKLHPMQQAFLDCDAFQCGACTSGQIMSAVGLLKEPVGRDDASVKDSMSGNICRCGAYKNILAAVNSVRAANVS